MTTWSHRDTGQVGIQHFSHCHQRLALPGRKQKIVTGPTSTVSAHFRRLQFDRAGSHFKKDGPLTPWQAETQGRKALFQMGAVHNFEHQCSALEQMKGGQEAHNAVDLGFFSLQSVGYSAPSPECHLSLRLIGSHTDSFLYGPIITSIHDYWKNHSFDEMDLCQQSNVSAF